MMDEKPNLAELAKEFNRELVDGFQVIFDQLNKGQTKKVLENKTVTFLVEKYKIQHK